MRASPTPHVRAVPFVLALDTPLATVLLMLHEMGHTIYNYNMKQSCTVQFYQKLFRLLVGVIVIFSIDMWGNSYSSDCNYVK